MNIEALVRATLHSPPAGVLASELTPPVTHNVVCGTYVGVSLKKPVLDRLGLVANLRRFTAIVCKLAFRKVHCTALVFGCGSVQFVGCPSVDAALLINHRLVEMLRERGSPRAYMHFFSIDNMVADGGLRKAVNLSLMHNNMQGFQTMYVPDLFPGLVCMCIAGAAATADGDPRSYRICTFVVFRNGQVTALGIEHQDREIVLHKYIELCAMALVYQDNSNPQAPFTPNPRRGQRDSETISPDDRSKAGKIQRIAREYVRQNASRMNDTTFASSVSAHLEEMVRQSLEEERRKKNKRLFNAQSRKGKAAAIAVEAGAIDADDVDIADVPPEEAAMLNAIAEEYGDDAEAIDELQ